MGFRWKLLLVVLAASLLDQYGASPLGQLCSSDLELVGRGLSSAQVAQWNEKGRASFARLFSQWGGKQESERLAGVVISGDSLMDQLHQVVLCAAVALGCDVRRGEVTRVSAGGATRVYSPDELSTADMRTPGNGQVEGFVLPHRVTCPRAGPLPSAVDFGLTYIRYYVLVGSRGRGGACPLCMARETLRRLVERSEAGFFYANTGHDALQQHRQGLAATTHIITEAAKVLRRPGDLRRPAVFAVVAHPPQHFVGRGDKTGNFARRRPRNAKARRCTCAVGRYRKSATYKSNTRTAEFVRSLDAGRGVRVGMVAGFYYAFLSKPRCALHRSPGDCTHYLVHPAVWYPLADELHAAGATPRKQPLPPKNDTLKDQL